MRIAIAPSMQMHNSYICSGDVEGHVMGVLGQMVVDRLNRYGAPSVQAQRFWTTNEDGWTGVADGAAAWGDLVIAFHTDSAGNQDNDGRGHTGSLLCYKGGDEAGRRAGWLIMQRMLTDCGWPIAGERDYTGKLYMFGINSTPCCLLELGNHSDPDDCKFMLANLDKFADSIAWGIFEYLGINPREDKPQEDDEMKPILMTFGGPGHDKNISWLVDFSNMTKLRLETMDEINWFKNFKIEEVKGPQPHGELFAEIKRP